MYKKLIILSMLISLLALSSGGMLEIPQVQAQAFTGTNVNCDVIIYGGSTAALFAAITAARENKQTCLIEPTDWVGGQLTNSVPAIDWQWMTNINPNHGAVNGQVAHNSRNNNNFQFWDWMSAVTPQGSCWVSRDCFLGKDLLTQIINPYLATLPNLRIDYNTVVKSLNTTTTNNLKRINQLNAIKRTPVSGTGYDVKLSDDMADWYNTTNSARFTKNNLIYTGNNGNNPVIVEASEFSELLPLAGASYLQGNQVYEGSSQTLNEGCGQSITYTFNMKSNAAPVAENGPDRNSFDNTYGNFNFGSGNWDTAWNYRRLAGIGNPYASTFAPNQVSSTNWKSGNTNNGNDYAKDYLFKTYQQTASETSNWQGGVNYPAIKGAEDVSYKFYYYMKDNEPRGLGNTINLDFASMGTTTGLPKYPYLRDTRRSVGIDNYILKTSEMLANAPTGARFFADNVATISYPMDIHPIDNCTYSNDDKSLNLKQGVNAEPYPFYVPLRALTNKDVVNLVVAGKSIAQSFKTSAATRLQPGEATTGTAAGAFAAHLHTTNKTTYDIVRPATGTLKAEVAPIQTIVKKYQPITWIINGLTYPSPTDHLKNVKVDYNCPDGAIPDLAEGYCVDANNAYGPFSTAMTNQCVAAGGGNVCTQLQTFQVGSKTISATRWGKLFTRQLRGDGVCMNGLTADSVYKDYCVQGTGSTKEVFGPFTKDQVDKCFTQLGGGQACYANRWSYNFVTSIL